MLQQCSTRCWGGGPLRGHWGPPTRGLPFPHLRGRLQQVTWKMTGHFVPRWRQPNGPAPVIGADGLRFAYIWAKRGACVRPCVPRARPSASLRLFEVSLCALICLPLAASFTRQFLVDSLLTASLQPRPRWQRCFPGGQAGHGQRGQAGSTPQHPARCCHPSAWW